MIGITPLMQTFIGICVFCPPYCFLPTTRLAYWIGIRLSASFIKTIKPTSNIINARYASEMKTYLPFCPCSILSFASFPRYRASFGNLAAIPAKSMIEIPFPIPLSLMRLPIQTTMSAPATKSAMITAAAKYISLPAVYLSARFPLLSVMFLRVRK